MTGQTKVSHGIAIAELLAYIDEIRMCQDLPLYSKLSGFIAPPVFNFAYSKSNNV